MKNNKWLMVAVIWLSVLVLGLLAYIVVEKVGNKSEEKVEMTTSATTEAEVTDTEEPEVTEEVLSDDEEKELEKDSSSSENKTKKDNKKYACYAVISDGGNWQDGDMFVHQYNVQVFNKSDEDLKDWEIKIDGFSGAKMGDNWNAEYVISGDTLSCKAVEYNTVIQAHGTLDFGFQAKFKNSEDEKKEKTPSVYIEGRLYEVEKEEPTTASKEDKEASKKEKVEPEVGTPLENHGALSIEGTDIVDKNGKKYQLKGISTHGLAWFPDYVNKDAFKSLRNDWGANLIRLAMYTGESGGYCQDGDKNKLKKLVEDGVEYATELGMYVIIDWHILSDNNPDIHQDDAVEFFDEMSAKYSDYENVIYEICNEPNGGTTWGDVKSYAETVIPVIRANDKDAIIIVGTPTWSQDVDLAASDPLDGDNICYTVHFYAATHKDNIRNKLKEAHDKGLCIFISEFSICDASGNGGIDYDSADEWFDLINDYNISYAAWNLSNKNETSSLIDASSSKTSGWSDDELSETGIWIKNKMMSD